MLTIVVPETEFYDEKKQEFGKYNSQTLKLEHSLVSISKWESKWTKPFLVEGEKTSQEIKSYIKCMSVTPIQDETVFDRLSQENYNAITDYIDAPMTATWFNDRSKKQSKRIMTSEVIYAQMIGFGIPVEFEKWHINRLLTLIKVCNIMFNEDSKNKMTQKEIYQSNRELNEQRRKAANSKG